MHSFVALNRHGMSSPPLGDTVFLLLLGLKTRCVSVVTIVWMEFQFCTILYFILG